MISNMYSLFDKKTLVFHPPIFSHNALDAKRYFVRMLRSDRQLNFCVFPEDFRVYAVGTFNDSSGELVSCKSPELVCELLSLVEGSENEKEIEKNGNA